MAQTEEEARFETVDWLSPWETIMSSNRATEARSLIVLLTRDFRATGSGRGAV